MTESKNSNKINNSNISKSSNKIDKTNSEKTNKNIKSNLSDLIGELSESKDLISKDKSSKDFISKMDLSNIKEKKNNGKVKNTESTLNKKYAEKIVVKSDTDTKSHTKNGSMSNNTNNGSLMSFEE